MPRTQQAVNDDLKALHAEVEKLENGVEANLRPVYITDPESGEQVEITETYIKNIIHNMAKRIIKDFSGKSILFIGLMDGANFFANELLNALQALNAELPKSEQIRVNYTVAITSSYQGTERGELKIGELKVDVGGLIVMSLDDVLDSGGTLDGWNKVLAKLGAAEIYSAVLFNKEYPGRTLEATYSGLHLGDEFLVGAGMDLLTPRFRLLRTVKAVDIGTLPPSNVMKELKSKIKELNVELREIIFQQQQQQQQPKASEYSQHILMPPPRIIPKPESEPEPEPALESALESASASLIPVLY